MRSDLPFIRGGTRRVQAKIVRHDRMREDGATMYSAVLLLPDENGKFIQVRDSMYSPFPVPVLGEMVEVVHPIGLAAKARIPHPWFRTLMYGTLAYIFVILVLKITGLG